MGIINSLENTWNTIKGSKPSEAPPKPTSAPAATATTTTASLTSTSSATSSPTAASAVTQSQGHAARLALGGPSRTDDIPPPPPEQLSSKYDNNLPTEPKVPLNPKDPDSRLKDLNSVSQLGEGHQGDHDTKRCAASSIVAGAYYAGGTEGIQHLMADQAAYAKAHKLKGQDPYRGDKELRKHVESGQLTRGDLNKIQENLHRTLAERQDLKPGADPKEKGGKKGIDASVGAEFVKESTHTKKAFDEKGLVLCDVDTQRGSQGDHCVLAGQHNGQSFVYDPYSVNSVAPGDFGGELHQVTQDPDRLRLYRDSLVSVDNQKYIYSPANPPAR